MSTLAIVCATLVAAVVGAAVARADQPFSIDPSQALTGHDDQNQVTFSYVEGPDQTETWDLDGDGAYDDRSGATVRWTYPTPGRVNVGLAVTDTATGTTQTYSRQLNVTGPSASFVSFPASPVVGEQVTFVYSSTDPVDAGGIGWDLNGDGTYDDKFGPTAFRAFVLPGVYPVGVRVPSNVDDAVSTGIQFITVKPLPQAGGLGGPATAALMSPFPVVRITGRVTRRGSRIKRLAVTAPNGATVFVSCRGRGCPFRRSRHTVVISGHVPKPAKTVRFRKLGQRLLHGGTLLKILVSRPHEIGKYTRFLVRKGKPPLRRDLCLPPGTTKPAACPSS